MKNTSRVTVALIAGLSTAVLATSAALADTAVIPDPALDAIGVTSTNAVYGDWDIDLLSMTIDHHDDVLSIVGAFNYTESNSWNNLRVDLDTNLDGTADFALVWTKQYGYAKAFSTDSTGALGATLCDITTGETMGQGGTVSVSVPRSCIGSPTSVAVHLDVIWAGTLSGTTVYFVDSAPGTLADSPVTFSAPVSVSTTVVVPSVTTPEVVAAPPVVIPPAAPAPAAAAPAVAPLVTHLSLDASAKKQKYKKQSTRIVAFVDATTKPQGIVRFYDGKKAIAKATVHGGKAVLKLSKKTKVGTHKITAKFVPTTTAAFAPSTSKAVVVRVKK